MKLTFQELIGLGFTESEESEPGLWRVRCDSCDSLVINGVPCHERGCRRQSKECRECGGMIPAGESCDCLDYCEGDE